MKKLILSACAAISMMASAQDYAGVYTRTDGVANPLVRTFRYYPAEDGYIESYNGTNRYTRALYGGHSLWRLETSDRPVFAAYHKKQNRNISFFVTVNGRRINLTDAGKCISRYRGGERMYRLSDAAWGKGEIIITVLARHDAEGAIWKVESINMPVDTRLSVECCATVNVKLSRSGDIGADPKNAFDAHPDRLELKECDVKIGKKGTKYILYDDRSVTADNQNSLKKIYQKAQNDMSALTRRLKITTPDAYINSLGANLMAAGDGIWDGDTYQHGAIGWRMPLAGWRGAYTGDFLGQHDRARNHFDAYAASQVTDVPPVFAHPTQDSTMAMARAEKKWGTQMYSNGYICRNPRRKDQMHHYDMNLCYTDELLWHLRWTGDTAYMRQVWPVLKASLAWEKRNYDPDDDGLYDAYCCIWASDALYYNGGGVTHSTAYNYRANKLAAEVADRIGEDPQPYAHEAEKIKNALETVLWMPENGVWAEFKDLMGYGRLHDHPGVWTIYHAIDSDVASPFEYYRATRYIDERIPRFPIQVDAVADEDLGGAYVVSTTDWLPYAWSINNVAHAETLNTALAYWQAGRNDEAYKIFKGMVLDGMYLGASPGNIGQVSHYDAARGENYRDFADPVGVMSRALVQGLFGFEPDLINRRVTITPGFPSQWESASIEHSDFTYGYSRDNNIDQFSIDVKMPAAKEVILRVPGRRSSVEKITVDGKIASWANLDNAVGRPVVEIKTTPGKHDIKVVWVGESIESGYKPTGCFRPGFKEVSSGDMKWWIADDNKAQDKPVDPRALGIELMKGGNYQPIDISTYYNSSVDDIFHNRYESPRPEVTTLRIPLQGIGEWCHPLDSANIADSFLRQMAADGNGIVNLEYPFRTPAVGKNIVYTSLFDNYPDSVTIPVSGNGNGLALLMAGSTNHMQCYMENGLVTVEYTDGSRDSMPLIPPYNWCPIEQDYYIDSLAFKVEAPRPTRYSFNSGVLSDHIGDVMEISGVYGRRIDGGAATILCMPINPQKSVKSMTLKALSNDVVIGLMAATIVKDGNYIPAPMPDVNQVVDNTPDSLAVALTARPAPGSTRRGNNPVLFLVGNSTMRTGTKGNGDSGQWGWGYYMHQYFDPSKITVENQALGGMSTRTFYTKLWPEIRDAIRPGDYVVIELGHNDNGSYESGRARATIPGIGNDSLVVTIAGTDVTETVYTYGEYLRRYIKEIKKRGGTPILMSLTPRNAWDDADSTKITRVDKTYGGWAREVAASENVPFVDLNRLTADKYERYGKDKVKYMFFKDRIHTSAFGARVNAESAVEGILANKALESLASAIVNPPYIFQTGSGRQSGKPLSFMVGEKRGVTMPDNEVCESYLRDDESLRSLVTSGRWDNIYRALQPGDIVYICYGECNTGAYDSGKELGTLPYGNAPKVCKMASDGRYEVIGPLEWYLNKIKYDITEKGARYKLVNFPE